MDSACTAHITFDRSLFETYEPLDSASVEMGTKASAKVAGRGDVHLKLNVNGRIERCKLTDVLHVPDFAFCLLFVSLMTDVGINVGFGDGKISVATTVAPRFRTHLMRPKARCNCSRNWNVGSRTSRSGYSIVSDIGSAHAATLQTWHERFVHMHFQGIASMIRDNVVSGVELLGNEAKT